MYRYLGALLLSLVAIPRVYSCDAAAGVVAYTKVDEQILILLADHKINRTRGWAAFGGCVDDGETVERAALREFHEETRCAFDNGLIINRDDAHIKVGIFTSYALNVPHIDAQQIGDNPLRSDCSGVVAYERGPWSWVPLSDLLDLFETDMSKNIRFDKKMLPTAEHRWFWNKSARVIKLLAQQGAFYAD